MALDVRRCDRPYSSELTALIAANMRQMPPFVAMGDDEIRSIIDCPDHYNDLYYPRSPGANVVLTGLLGYRLACAAQLRLDPVDGAFIHWFFARGGLGPAIEFLRQLMAFGMRVQRLRQMADLLAFASRSFIG